MTDHELLLTILDELKDVKDELKDVKQEQHSMKLILENETNKKINLMYESHQSIIKKLDQVEQIDPLKDRVSDVERAVIVHTAQIAELKKA